ncbi:hypothetical protein BGL34_04320 [Fructilactobacillus lindneri]|uniref:Uncharacterized protein n=1 Tax=Fructilactobacillus lindneri TaxID=53444 RepID=A0AB33BQN0_9LACO|nr:hypothetical protein [Fructilactobacillus lindneri]ANZ57659.1 hypothetical protein AYR60_02220 [Fructilactobacillus lindneri]ANZ58929.1 hypothetical protein AYR59_02220 [Fructilactobacillus lindneri]POG97956.1 hypothetical protein BGL31_04435 [Fructilactobacillus lindneri]POG99008.1 hypothetical protein BGL32_06150 [Fructilactobacillus lindneri]POH01500.1 hypothetical protein BGL33_05235 [Fructilactobacillus lindneri]
MVKFMKITLITGLLLTVFGLAIGLTGYYGGGQMKGFEKAYTHNNNHISFDFGDDDDDGDYD